MALRTPCGLLLLLLAPCLASNVEIAFKVDEETPVGTKVYDLRTSGKFPVNTSFDGSGSGHYFDISTRGVIRVDRRLDRESTAMCPKQNLEVCRLTFVVLAGVRMQVVSVTVTVADINDHAPAWPGPSLLVHVAENEALNKTVPFQMAKDPDLGRNAVVSYRLVSPSEYFAVITSTGFGVGAPPVPLLVVTGNLDREWQPWHNLTVMAVDGSAPFKRGVVQVTVRVTDENDNTPVFGKEEYVATVDEDASVDSLVIALEAEDRDEGVNAEIEYYLAVSTPDEVRRVFRVDPRSGQVRVRAPLNYEVESRYEFQVMARDGGSTPRVASTRVIVRLRDKNDHKPRIVAKPYPNHLQRFQVVENVGRGTILAAVTVRDADSGRANNDVNCSLSPMKDFNLEFLATSVGQKIFRIFTTRAFDREAKDRYVVTVTCWDAGRPPLTGYEDIEIVIVDENDCLPEFRPGPRFAVNVPEGNAPGDQVARTPAVDLDAGANGRVSYRIAWPAERYGENPFVINGKGQILAKRSLDRETHPDGFRFHVVATDGGSPPLSSTATVTLNLRDINDNAPRFERAVYNFKVKETVDSYFGVAVGTVNATDRDQGRNGLVNYRLLPESSPFSMHTRGQIFTRRHIDRETTAAYSVQVLAFDMAEDPTARHTVTVPVHIEVLDINDNPPVFLYPNASRLRVRVSYREPPGFRLLTVKATDRDRDLNARITYVIVSGNTYGVFALDKDKGDLCVVRAMTKIPKETVTLRVRATDNGNKPLFAETTIAVEIDESEPKGLQAGAGEAFDLETNKLIIICIVVATAVICAVLITAICFMARGTPCLLGVRGFAAPASHGRPEHVLVRPIQKTPMKSSSLQSLHNRPYTDPTAEPAPEVRFETFLGPLRSHPEEVADSDGDSGRGGSVKYFTNPDAIPLERHTYNNGALYVTVRPDTLTANVSTSLV